VGFEDENRAILRRLIDRIEVERLVDEVQAEIEILPEYSSFVGPGDEQDDRGRTSIRQNLEVFLAWATSEGPPPEEDLQRVRDLMGVRASEGRPMRDGLIVYRRAMRAAWQAVLARADERERVALGGAFEVPLDWLDLVSDEYEAAYAAERDARVSAHERRARWLLELVATGRDDDGDAKRLAEGLGFELAPEYRPFVATLPGSSASAHLRLAADLRRQGALARSEAMIVGGLAHERPDLGSLPPSVVIAVGSTTPKGALTARFEDLRTAVGLAVGEGRRGLVDPDLYAVQVMIARSPEQVRQIERRFLDPLVEAGRDDLARTLTSLARSGFDRSATSDELGIHRNTLTQRIDRAAEIAGIDLGDPSVRGSLWIVAVAGDVRRALPEGPRRDPRT